MNDTNKQVKHLSLWRILFAIILVVGLSFLSVTNLKTWQDEKAIEPNKSWFAPYVDVTSTPTYAFEQLRTNLPVNVILAFIVSSKSDACIPTWGAAYTMDEAGVSLDLDRRIARLRQQSGQIAISFGGALNDELALKCTDPDKLLSAYHSVIDRYDVDTIDLDLENEGLNNTEALTRRADVIAKLQEKRRLDGKHLAVWLTLPVAPQGLTEAGTNAVSSMLLSGVDLAGINVMTMDYGGSKDQGQTMLDASIDALTQTHRQLGIIYKQAEINLSSISIWAKIGATPMIGQNDVVNEVFSLEDAIGFNTFTLEKGIGRMSMWSANRDIPCGENYVDIKIVSDSCSGVKSEKLSFTKALSKEYMGEISKSASVITVEDQESNEIPQDDPETSPYQIWKEIDTYLQGVKVVWHGNVYEAKWWTKGDVPDNPVLQSWETPWRLIGPVLVGEKPIPQPTLPPGTYPEWSGTVEYQAGVRVLFEGIPFQAKWWNKGQSPAASAANSDSSPWLSISQTEVMNMFATLGKK